MAVLKYWNGTTYVPLAVTTGGGGGGARVTTSFTTASLAASATGTGTVALGDAYRLYTITTSAPARVRLYTTLAKRTADDARPIGTDPTQGTDHGLMLEFITDVDPPVVGSDEYLTPSVPTSQNALNTMYGQKYRFGMAGRVKGVRYNVPSSANLTTPGVFEFYLFSAAGTMLASKDVTGPALTAGVWNTILFDSPVAVTPATTYVVAFYAGNASDAVYVNNTFPWAGQSSGNVTAIANSIDAPVCVQSAPRDTCPTADAERGIWGITPVFNSVSESPPGTYDLSPMVDGFDGDADGLVPWSVTNLSGSTAAITVTFVYQVTEG